MRPFRPLLAAIALAAGLASPAGAETISEQTRVLDGDTLAVAGQRVRLSGIDAQESRQTCTRDGRRRACGKASTRAMRRLIGYGPVRCEALGRDRYGRAVAACFAAGRDLQRQLVRMGLTLAYRRYSTRYVPDEDAARAEGLGLWSSSFVEPWRWRRGQRRPIAARSRRTNPMPSKRRFQGGPRCQSRSPSPTPHCMRTILRRSAAPHPSPTAGTTNSPEMSKTASIS